MVIDGKMALNNLEVVKRCESPGKALINRSKVSFESSSSVASLLAALKNCSSSRDLERGFEVHQQAVSSGLLSNPYVATSLISAYGKCGNMVEARKVFDGLVRPNVVAWTALVAGYVDAGENELALELFDGMEACGCLPNARTFVAAVSACATLASRNRNCSSRWLEKGKAVHSQAVRQRCCDVFVESRLVDMYAKCGCMEEARGVFDGMSKRNLVAWTVLLQGYVENGKSELALELFEGLEKSDLSQGGFVADARIYVAALKACAALAGKEDRRKCSSRWLEKGKGIHFRAVTNRCCNIFVENAAIVMYGKCGSMQLARTVFDGMIRRDVISWNSLLQGYVENGGSELALKLFDQMDEGPSRRTYIAALSACSALGNGSCLQIGKWIHSRVLAAGIDDVFVDSSLVDMYGKCSSMADAQRVFDGMIDRNVVSWTGLISGYVKNGEKELAMELLKAMDSSCVEKNFLTYVAAVKAASGSVEKGREIHAGIRSSGLEKDLMVANSLVDFYGKCGSMEVAKQVFDLIPRKTIVSWTSLMCGYSLQGDTAKVFEVFEKMKDQGIEPDEVSSLCVLTACSYAGLTERGRQFFAEMQPRYGVTPSLQHFNCVVDLLGRSDCVEEALMVVRAMPFEADVVTWTALLSACQKWGNETIGKAAYEGLMKLDSSSV